MYISQEKKLVMKKEQKVRTKKDTIILTENNYKAAGGQGAVFCKDGYAYKIYHDPSTMIPVAKIEELSLLKRDNILAPIEPLFDPIKNIPIGFVMKYIDGTEFLCKIFTQNFKDEKSLSPTDIISLVKEKQETLKYIHAHNCLAVDYNELNFLLDQKIKHVYFIDVDNYQTKNFKATAIMESIRDRLSPKGVFTEFTDWYSWAIVTFQMYIGIHPYRGFHPSFKPSEWGKRMELGISVFDKDVKIPDSCQDFSVIPKNHLEWYKRVFIKNERSIPPLPDDALYTIPVIKLIASKGDFIIETVDEMEDPIRSVFFFNGDRYIITTKGVYLCTAKSKTLVYEIKKAFKNDPFGMCDVFGGKPIFVSLVNNKATFYNIEKEISSISAEDMMGYNNLIYTTNKNQLVENSFEVFGKLIHRTKNICNISSSHKVFRGVVVQDVFMKCFLAIPFDKGKCINSHIKELDNQRIIDARYDRGICILIAEKQGRYIKYTLCFNAEHSDYAITQEEILNLHAINFIVLPNSICISIDDKKLSIFNKTQKKEISDNLPFDVSSRLYNNNMQVLFVCRNKLYSVSMK